MNAAGKSTRELAKWRHGARIVLVALALLLLILIALQGLKAPGAIGLVVCLLAMVGLEKLVDPVLDWLILREEQATHGADAEELIGAILDRLPNDHVVLHDIVTRYGNIDHLVFRKDGAVFLVETKSHRGVVHEVLAGGFLPQMHRNVYWLRDFLVTRLGCEVWINAAMVFPLAQASVRRRLRGVEVLGAHSLVRWMAETAGKPEVARKLWPEAEALKASLAREK